MVGFLYISINYLTSPAILSLYKTQISLKFILPGASQSLLLSLQKRFVGV